MTFWASAPILFLMWSKPNGTCPDSIFLRHLQYPKTSQLFPSQHTSVCVPLQGGSGPGVHSQVQASIGLWVCRAVTFKPRHPYGSTHTAVHLAKSDEDPGANSWETSWHQYLSLWVPGRHTQVGFCDDFQVIPVAYCVKCPSSELPYFQELKIKMF